MVTATRLMALGEYLATPADWERFEVYDGVAADPLGIVALDFSFVRMDRLPPRQAWGRPFLIPPDLAVEILTTNSTGTRIEEKIRYYQDAGVPLILMVDMGRRTIIAPGTDGTRRDYGIDDILDGGAVLPDLRIPVADIFQ